MTSTPPHTRESLEAMPARELDAVVAEVVMGYVWKTCPGYEFPLLYRPDEKINRTDWGFIDLIGEPHPRVPDYSTSYEGFGAVVERVRELGISMVVGGHPDYPPAVKLFRGGYGVFLSHESCTFNWADIRRAACIAAVLAVQGAKL